MICNVQNTIIKRLCNYDMSCSENVAIKIYDMFETLSWIFTTDQQGRQYQIIMKLICRYDA